MTKRMEKRTLRKCDFVSLVLVVVEEMAEVKLETYCLD
jgi:hypothetical protein